jgi:hypothetical protein
MPVTNVKSSWNSGNLNFRRTNNNPILGMDGTSGRIYEYMTVTDIDAQNGTLTAAALAGGIIVHTSATGGGTLTFDTAAAIIAACPGMEDGSVFTAYVINDGDQTVTLAADGGATVTVSDTGQTIAINEAVKLLVRRTSATAVTVYVVGA